ncbi:MAG: coniferyl-alcohol dehydrogenase [Rhizobiaceae bacterium]|nr:coniferyl-alcohol dehydrogenase [Rhizobiaceae bacterium]
MRVALTGGASGIGAAVAANLKRLGADIVAFDIVEPRVNIDQWVKVDLSDPTSILEAEQQVSGSFDALINNAGLPPRKGLEEKVLAVNYFGLVNFTNLMIPKLTQGGAIVNTASKAGARWRENIPQIRALRDLTDVDGLPAFIETQAISPVRAYDLSKEAVILWTITQTERLAALGLRVNTVSPAAVSTDILDDFVTAFGERATKAMARIGRPGTPEEVAEVICFLASPQSNWLKGIDIPIDGGLAAMSLSDGLEMSI